MNEVAKHKRKLFQQLFRKEIFFNLLSNEVAKLACTFSKYILNLYSRVYINPLKNTDYCITLEETFMSIRSPDIKQPSDNVSTVLI